MHASFTACLPIFNQRLYACVLHCLLASLQPAFSLPAFSTSRVPHVPLALTCALLRYRPAVSTGFRAVTCYAGRTSNDRQSAAQLPGHANLNTATLAFHNSMLVLTTLCWQQQASDCCQCKMRHACSTRVFLVSLRPAQILTASSVPSSHSQHQHRRQHVCARSTASSNASRPAQH